MGVFIRNKTKRVQKTEEKAPVLINTNPNESKVSENNAVIEKKAIKSGFGDIKTKTTEVKKSVIDNISINKEQNKTVTPFNQSKKDNHPATLLFNKNKDLSFERIVEIPTTEKKINEFKYNTPPKKYALTTILNDSFGEYFYVFLNSFLENNKWFKGDIVILHNKQLSELSDDKIRKIGLLYRNIIFKEIETNKYDYIINLFKERVSANMHRFIPSILTIEAFNLTEYDKVLYLDSDMLVVNDISNLFLISNNIVVTRDTSVYTTDNVIKEINQNEPLLNGGFLLLDGDFIKSDNHVNNMIDIFPTIKQPKFLDQSLMNEYFKNFEVLFISSDYNLLKRCFDDSKESQLKLNLKNIKIIHYVGEKPWNPKQKDFEKKYKAIEKLWFDYNDRYKNISNKIDGINLISSGINSEKLSRLAPNIKNYDTVTTNWGFNFNNIIDIDYYYCSTPELPLLTEINDKNFKPNKLWLLTDNVSVKLGKLKNEKLSNVDPFHFMKNRSPEYYSIIEKRKENKKYLLPTSGASMLLFFSLLDISNINIIGYNLYSRVNIDGSYKQFGTSKFVNPYTDKNKPHSIEFDLNFIIIALNTLINKNVNVNFYESYIVKDMYNLLRKNWEVGEIITHIKLKYYGEN